MNISLLNEVYTLKEIIADLDLIKEYHQAENDLINSPIYQRNKEYFDSLMQSVNNDELLMRIKSDIVSELSSTKEGQNYLRLYRKIFAFYQRFNTELFYPFYQ